MTSIEMITQFTQLSIVKFFALLSSYSELFSIAFIFPNAVQVSIYDYIKLSFIFEQTIQWWCSVMHNVDWNQLQ